VIDLFKIGQLHNYYYWLLCSFFENDTKGTVSQNSTVLLYIKRKTFFGLLGHHQVSKFYDTKYRFCVANIKISFSGP